LAPTLFIDGLGCTYGIALSGNNLFVSDACDGDVDEYNATTGASIKAPLITAVNFPSGLAVSGTNLLVANGGRISEYNASTGAGLNLNFITGLTNFSVLLV
jgi:hypothetical protein